MTMTDAKVNQKRSFFKRFRDDYYYYYCLMPPLYARSYARIYATVSERHVRPIRQDSPPSRLPEFDPIVEIV